MAYYVNNIIIPNPPVLGTTGILMAYEIRKTVAPFTLYQGDLNTPVAGLVAYSGTTLNDYRNSILAFLDQIGLISLSWPAWDGDTTDLVPTGDAQVYSIDPAFVALDTISIATNSTDPITGPSPGVVPPNEQYTLTIKLYAAATAPVPFFDSLQSYIDNEGGLQLLTQMFKPVE